MVQPFHQKKNALIWGMNHETLRIEAWGKDCLRVRSTREAELQETPWALLTPPPVEAGIEISNERGLVRSGSLQAEVLADGSLRFTRTTGEVLLEETPPRVVMPPAREYRANHSPLWHIEVRFRAQDGERFYGLGQHTHGLLDQKGCVIELMQRNTQVSIPFMVSNHGYGFLWNNPAIGRVELGRDVTRWVAEATRQVDYLVMTGASYSEIMERYADATGHPLELPEFAAGFWQCKLRYRTQEELLSVVREYKKRGLPLSVIVVDFFHWTMLGDWQFDPKDWPDPAGMVGELEAMGVKLMVSIWPSVNPNSQNFDEMSRQGWLVRSERGLAVQMAFVDTSPAGKVYPHIYDATHPEARRFVWEQVRKNYLAHGIKVWWLDACEPELYPADHDNLRYHLGNGLEVGNIYPMLHAQGFYDGMHSAGETGIITLCRSAWAGSQRYGAAVWSGDIPSTFEMLQIQVRAGLNIAMSGIPWWTTDIGGFVGGDITTPYFRELIVRWFQFGLFCPLFRLHGIRTPEEGTGSEATGAPNEVWSFGDEAYAIIKEMLFMREVMRPYIMAQMRLAHEKGTPVMRPIFFDFSQDTACYSVEDQFMFGPDILVAPVLFQGATERKVYLPSSTDWDDAWTGKQLAGGQWITTMTPLDKIPLYFRHGAKPF
jgi:alpha-D-xyloside xylohydrolase